MSAADLSPRPASSPLGVGIDRIRIEMRGLVRSRSQFFFTVVFWPILIGVVAGPGSQKLDGTDLPANAFVALGLLSAALFQFGMFRVAQTLAQDRQDGSLLRARSLPGGIVSYLVGRLGTSLVVAVMSIVLMLVVANVVADVPLPRSIGLWGVLIGVVLLGLLATGALGLILGAVLPNGREAIGLITIPWVVLMFISGVYASSASLPCAVQVVGGIFPMRWIGQGLRGAMLPDEFKTAEIGDTWDRPATFAVLLVWTVVGGILAAYLLRRAAQRESGSTLEERQRKQAGKLR